MRAGPRGPLPPRRTATCTSAPSLRPAAAAVAHETSAPHRRGGCHRGRPSSPVPCVGNGEGHP
eukprot:5726284-Alexandrium_andersonii.AAC.1